MPCPTCGAPAASPTQKFCAECGTALARVCPSCSKPYDGTPKFCPECGYGLAGITPAGAAAAATPATSAAEATAERKLVTVLFADLVGFTTMSEQADAEAVREKLSEYFAIAQEVIGRYGGSIEKFIGDAVMAVWGTPTAHEDDAERGVRAALELIEAVPHLSHAGQALSIRAGVLTGEAAVTLGASNQGMVAGDLVNTASRLQSVAPPNTVLVGEATFRSAESAIVFEPVGEQELKGKASPVPAYRALRVVAKRGGAGRGEQLEAPFRGRDAEMRLIKELFHAAPREKRPRLVSIVGQAGIGKSRLAWEFLKYIDGILETVLWHQGRSPAYGEGIGYWALAEMVRSRVGLLELDDQATSRTKLAETLETYVPDEAERRWIAPKMEQLLGFGDAESGSREELFAAWRTFFERVAGETSTAVLVFEDLHWADPGLLDFIEHVLEWSRGHALYIITLARPELLDRRPTWGAGQRSFTSLTLEPLPDEVIGEILASLVPGLPAAAMAQIVRRAEGIPLYAVETVRMLLQDGRLEPAEGAYRPVGDLTSMAVPASLQALIAARLDALDAADRTLLQHASVLGQTFTIEGLRAIAGEQDELPERLRALVRRELLTLDTDPRSPELGQYGFVQALVHDVAYGTLTRHDRKLLHLAAGRYFESLGDEEIIGATASHFVDAYRNGPDDPDAGEIKTHTVELLRRAADRSNTLGSYEQAARFLELAIDLAPDPADLSDLLRLAGDAYAAAGRFDQAEELVRRAISEAEAAGDRRAQALAVASLGRALATSTQMTAAIEVITAALPALEGMEQDPSMVHVWAALSRAYMLHAQPAEAVEWADRALPLAERLDMVPEIADLLTTRATALGYGGRAREGVAILRGVLELATSYGLSYAMLRTRTNLSSVLVMEDPVASFRAAIGGFEDAKRTGSRTLMSRMGTNAAERAVHIGDWEAAQAILSDLEAFELAASDRFNVDLLVIALGALRGEPVPDGVVARAEEFVTSRHEPGLIGALRETTGWAALAGGRFADAHADALTAIEDDPTYTPTSGPLRARGALWAGMATEAAAAAEQFRASGYHGRAISADLAVVDAAAAAAAGRIDEAAAKYREAIRLWRDLGGLFDVALAELDFVKFVGGEDPDVKAGAEEARAIFTRLGATPFVERLNESVGLPVG